MRAVSDCATAIKSTELLRSASASTVTARGIMRLRCWSGYEADVEGQVAAACFCLGL